VQRVRGTDQPGRVGRRVTPSNRPRFPRATGPCLARTPGLLTSSLA
jgi:hypothetical protein